MKIILVLLLLTHRSVQKRMSYNCTKTQPLAGSMNMTEKTIETFLTTTANASMSIGQTNCYNLMVDDGEKEVKSGRRAFISLVNSVQEYEFKSAYNFTEPTVKVNCECNCEICVNSCCDRDDYSYANNCTGRHSTGSKNCGESENSKGQCNINFTRPASKDCALCATALCCQIMIYHNSLLPPYTAAFFTKNTTVWDFEMGIADNNGELIGELVKFSLSSIANEITTTISQVEIVDQFVEQQPELSSTWYFMNLTNRELYAGIPVNGLDERNFHKFGWYKLNATGEALLLDWNEIQRSLNFSVNDCLRNNNSWQFSASYYNRDGISMNVRVQDPPITTTNVEFDPSRNIVKVRAKNDSSAILQFKFNVSTQLLFQYQEIKLDKFHAEIRVNHTGNSTLLLLLYEASGWFYVSMEGLFAHIEAWIVGVSSMKPVDSFKTLIIPCEHQCPSEVCIYGNESRFMQCVNASCIDERPNDECPTCDADVWKVPALIFLGALVILVISLLVWLVRKCRRVNSETTEPFSPLLERGSQGEVTFLSGPYLLTVDTELPELEVNTLTNQPNRTAEGDSDSEYTTLS